MEVAGVIALPTKPCLVDFLIKELPPPTPNRPTVSTICALKTWQCAPKPSTHRLLDLRPPRLGGGHALEALPAPLLVHAGAANLLEQREALGVAHVAHVHDLRRVEGHGRPGAPKRDATHERELQHRGLPTCSMGGTQVGSPASPLSHLPLLHDVVGVGAREARTLQQVANLGLAARAGYRRACAQRCTGGLHSEGERETRAPQS